MVGSITKGVLISPHKSAAEVNDLPCNGYRQADGGSGKDLTYPGSPMLAVENREASQSITISRRDLIFPATRDGIPVDRKPRKEVMCDFPPLRVDQVVGPKFPISKSVQSARRGEELRGLGFCCAGATGVQLDLLGNKGQSPATDLFDDLPPTSISLQQPSSKAELQDSGHIRSGPSGIREEVSNKGNNIGGAPAASNTAESQAESESDVGFSMAAARDMGLSKARSGYSAPASKTSKLECKAKGMVVETLEFDYMDHSTIAPFKDMDYDANNGRLLGFVAGALQVEPPLSSNPCHFTNCTSTKSHGELLPSASLGKRVDQELMADDTLFPGGASELSVNGRDTSETAAGGGLLGPTEGDKSPAGANTSKEGNILGSGMAGEGYVHHYPDIPNTTNLEMANGPPVKSWKSLVSIPVKSGSPLQFYRPHCANGKLVAKSPAEAVNEGIDMWKGCLVGQFLDKRLPFPVVRSLVNRLWGKREMPEISTTGNGLFFFRFKDPEARDWVMNAGPWHLAGRPFIVRAWKPGMDDEDTFE